MANKAGQMQPQPTPCAYTRPTSIVLPMHVHERGPHALHIARGLCPSWGLTLLAAQREQRLDDRRVGQRRRVPQAVLLPAHAQHAIDALFHSHKLLWAFHKL